MKKFKQFAYTLFIMVTCVVASPLIFKQIWDTSAEKKQQPAAPMAEIDITKGFPISTSLNVTTEPPTTTVTTEAAVSENETETETTTTSKKKETTASTTKKPKKTTTTTAETTTVDKSDDETTTTTAETTKEASSKTEEKKTTSDKKDTTKTESTTKTTTTTTKKTTSEKTTTTKKPSDDKVYEFVKGDESFFDDALFIGDSRTVGIKEYGSIKNADYYCEVGLNTGKAKREADNGAIANMLKSKKYGKVYIMLGINEIGNDFEWIMSDYQQLISNVQKHAPDAVIFLEANLHVTSGAQTSSINNERLNYLNGRLKALADNKKIFYIDINPVFDDENGNLRSDCASDGIHVYAKYYQSWSDWFYLYTIKK